MDDLKENVKEKQTAGKEAVADKVDEPHVKRPMQKYKVKSLGRFKGKM